MTLERVRCQLKTLRSSSESEGRVLKDAQLTLDRLRTAYEAMSDEDRPSAEAVIVEWLASDDENRRFDAIALTDEFRIASAAAGLRRLRTRLLTSNAPGAPFEIEKIDRVLGGLTSGSGGP